MARILVIEDDALLRAVLCDLLQSENHEVRHAANGVAGVKAFRERPADLVIIDMLMPEMDGVETISILRRQSPTPLIIAMSDDGPGSAELYLKIAKQLGAQRTLTKPFPAEDLLVAVCEVLEGT